jgi:hypothetical protein
MGTGTKENESSTGRVWAAGFHHVTAHSRLACVLKIMNHYFFNFTIFFSGRGKLRISEPVDTGAQLYFTVDPTDFLYSYVPFTDITNQMGVCWSGTGQQG